MPSKDPAFLFYSKDWLQGTAKLFPAEKGVYIDLLAHQHQDGFLPINSNRLAKIAGLPHDEFLIIWEGIKDKFHEESGKLYNEKLISVTTNRAEHGEMRTIVGTFGQLIKTTVCTEEKKAQIRKTFNFKDYLGLDKANLTILLTKYITNCLANGTAKHGNAIGNGNGNAIINNKEDNRFWFLKFYHSTYDYYKEIFNGQSTTEAYFVQWKKFIDFIYEKKYEELFECKFLSPHDFADLVKKERFTPDKWDEPLKRILATGIKPEQNLFFRIPEFIKYGKGNNTNKTTSGNPGKTLDFDKP